MQRAEFFLPERQTKIYGRVLHVEQLRVLCVSQDWEYLLSSNHHQHFSACHDGYLGFDASREVQAPDSENSTAPHFDVDATTPLFPHIAAILYALHLVYEVRCYSVIYVIETYVY